MGIVIIPVTLYSVWVQSYIMIGWRVSKPPYRGKFRRVNKVAAVAICALFLIPLRLDGVGWLGMTLYAIAFALRYIPLLAGSLHGWRIERKVSLGKRYAPVLDTPTRPQVARP